MENMTRLLAAVLRQVPKEDWQTAQFPPTHTVHLAQTCTTIRDAIREARLPAALCLTHHRLSFACERYEIEAVKLVTETKFLDCARYKFAHEKQLIEMLPQMPKLKTLFMHDMCMGLYYQNRAFFLALGHCPGLRSLTLSCNALGTVYWEQDATLLAYRMTQLPLLQYLDLSRNNLGTGSVLRILNACQQCPSLTELRLQFNTVSFNWDQNCDIGSVLTTLDLSGCQVVDDEVLSENDGLHRFFMGCQSLIALNLSNNDLTRTHVNSIVYGLKYMPRLESLDLTDNSLSVRSKRLIRLAWTGDPDSLMM